MKKTDNNYLYLEPYIHLEVCENKLLLYNTLSGTIIEESEKKIVKIFKRLKNENKVILTKVSHQELHTGNLKSFINKLKKLYIGDLISADQMPIQVSPLVKIEFDYDTLYGPNILNNLLELYIYLNNYNTDLCSPKFIDAFRQFPTNYSRSENHDLSINDILSFIKEGKKGCLSKINILGGNIFEYNHFESLIIYLNSIVQKKEYYLYYKDKIDIDKLKMIGKNSKINIIVDFPMNENHLEKTYQIIFSSLIPTNVQFIIESENDMNLTEDLSIRHSFKDIKIIPYFNKVNSKFFLEQVYLNKSDIYDTKPSQDDLFKNQILNSFYFGKLTILNNGSVYTNINGLSIGTIKDSIYEIVNNALKCKDSWRLIREDVTPCNGCIYKTFCPPISNYENVFGHYNLCTIKS